MQDLIINEEKALEFILEWIYRSEFRVIDGTNRHPDFVNFYQWAYERELIPESELARAHDEMLGEECED